MIKDKIDDAFFNVLDQTKLHVSNNVRHQIYKHTHLDNEMWWKVWLQLKRGINDERQDSGSGILASYG
jgi:hypothetical protein